MNPSNDMRLPEDRRASWRARTLADLTRYAREGRWSWGDGVDENAIARYVSGCATEQERLLIEEAMTVFPDLKNCVTDILKMIESMNTSQELQISFDSPNVLDVDFEAFRILAVLSKAAKARLSAGDIADQLSSSFGTRVRFPVVLALMRELETGGLVDSVDELNASEVAEKRYALSPRGEAVYEKTCVFIVNHKLSHASWMPYVV